MKKIVFLFLLPVIALGGCNSMDSKKKKEAAVKKRSKAELREENDDVDFGAFVSRLKKAVAAHDANTLASMMTADFAYVLGATEAEDRKGDGVFKYWDENGLWTELDAILMRALKRNPAERYATAAEMRDDLETWLSNRELTPSASVNDPASVRCCGGRASVCEPPTPVPECRLTQSKRWCCTNSVLRISN